MSNRRKTYHEHRPNFDDQPTTGAAKAANQDRFAASVAEILERHWLEDERTSNCFDFNETRAEALLQFIADASEPEVTEEIRTHLSQCARCRFIYASTYEAASHTTTPMCAHAADSGEMQSEEIPSILRENLRSTGPVVFPDGEVADGAWEFGRMTKLRETVADSINAVICDRAWDRLRPGLPRRGVVIVCFSQPMHKCGKRLAAKLDAAGTEDIHVVMADGFFEPKLWCDPKELHRRHVIVLVDVIHTGGLLRRLFELCRKTGPHDLMGVAVIDQSVAARNVGHPLLGLWQEKPEKRTRYHGSPGTHVRFFDPVAALSLPQDELPSEVADSKNARLTIERLLTDIAPLLPYIESTGALKQDAEIGGAHYPWAIDLLCLLGDERARNELASRALSALEPLAARGPWCLVYHAARHQRAGAWATLIAKVFGWPIVKVGHKSCAHFQPIEKAQHRALTKSPRMLVVDAAIRTGKTLNSLVALIRRARLPADGEIASFYAFDGLFDEQRGDLQQNLRVDVHSLFRLPLGAPTEPVGRHCRQRLKGTLEELDDPKSREHALWADPVRAYCRKKLVQVGRPPRHTPKLNVEWSLRRALDEGQRGSEARLEHACDPPRPSLLKQLDMSYALREPRTRNVLHGFLCNSMPPDFIEWCAIALATLGDYEWLDHDWLVLHKWFFTDSLSSRWLFLACVTYWLRREGRSEQVDRVRNAIVTFRQSQTSEQLALFPDLIEATLPDRLSERCHALLSVLSS